VTGNNLLPSGVSDKLDSLVSASSCSIAASRTLSFIGAGWYGLLQLGPSFVNQ
jgi:hypothetical protein